MSKIRTHHDLLELKQQLQSDLAASRELIKKDVAALKEEWRPVANVLSGLAKITTKGKTNPLLAIGIDILGDVVVRNILLAKSGWLTRLVVPFIAKNYSANFLNKNGSSLFHKLINKFTHRTSNGQLTIEK